MPAPFSPSSAWISPRFSSKSIASFAGGEDQVFDLKNDGVTYGKLNADGEKYADQMEEVKQKIIDGEITDIPAEVKGN